MHDESKRQDICEICGEFKDSDEIIDYTPNKGETICVCSDCLKTIFVGGRNGKRR